MAAFGEDLAAVDVLDLLKRAPDADSAVKVTREQIVALLQRAGRRKVDERAERIHTALYSEQLRVPAALQRAYAVTVKSLVAVITTPVEEIAAVEREMVKRLRKHKDAETYLCSDTVVRTSISCTNSGVFNDRLVAMNFSAPPSAATGAAVWSFNFTAFGSHKGGCSVDGSTRNVFSLADLYDEALGVRVRTS